MVYSLAPGISYGLSNGRAIVLDLVRDRYRLLSAELSETLARLENGLVAPEPIVASLAREGLISTAPGDRIAPVALERAAESALEIGPQAGRRAPTVFAVSSALLGTRAGLARRSLSQTVTRARACRDQQTNAQDDALAIVVAQKFAAVRAWVPVDRACMLESFSLNRMLVARRVVHDLVFGVRLAPFAAHAWVQTPSHVLSDRVERIAEFVPVFRL